ncbi:MAG: TetR/AcrR family transcriptional regulator [Clostridiales bacterium]|nr:TetR/AcrR family transcriptional regulator [Clostridiales bacterium]
MKRKNPTNDFLKECMADALLILLRKKPLENITIQEIATLADVGRVTYYRNFTSKEDILNFKLDKLMTEWVEKEMRVKDPTPYQLALKFFQFFAQNKELVQTLMQSELYLLLLRQLIDKLTIYGTPKQIGRYEQIFLSFGLCGIILTWMNTGMKESPEEMGEIVARNFLTRVIPTEKTGGEQNGETHRHQG